jgi:hypothetical protein
MAEVSYAISARTFFADHFCWWTRLAFYKPWKSKNATRCKDGDNTGKNNFGYRSLPIDEGIES